MIIDGEVIEARRAAPPQVDLADAHGPGHGRRAGVDLTYEIKEVGDGVCSLTIIHELPDSPLTAALTAGSDDLDGGGGGHPWILSDLKSLLETGKRMAD